MLRNFYADRARKAGGPPRQLTSITEPGGAAIHTFHYYAAGRQIGQDDLVMSYDATDRLLGIDDLPGGSVAHVDGHDGQRVKATAPDGGVSDFFGDGTAEREGGREHDVAVGDPSVGSCRFARSR